MGEGDPVTTAEAPKTLAEAIPQGLEATLAQITTEGDTPTTYEELIVAMNASSGNTEEERNTAATIFQGYFCNP